ncbi:MAG: squalene/phytoene synthase family protein [Verrucomicrobiae bacterium]|nr:squalene/phytoene synthase family protein [Verrucomicrobiae bacterium]
METSKNLNYDRHLDSILKGVSRSFYLTLRFLPPSVRPQISVAYLIARAADTIADTNIIPLENRIQTLRNIRDAILADSFTMNDLLYELGIKTEAADFSHDEKSLIENFGKVLRVYNSFSLEDRKLIKKVIYDITVGQELDLIRFSSADKSNIVPLSDDKELENYTFFVAGTVGDFWTRICFLHVMREQNLSPDEMVKLGVRYGKGLQLINILRDLPFDLIKGRCYIPLQSLKKHNLCPQDLLDVNNEEKFRPLYNHYLKLAFEHLRGGRDYVFSIPKRYFRLRFVTALPLLIGIKTLEEMYAGKVLDPGRKIKVSRGDVKKLVLLAALLYPVEHLWNKLFISKRLAPLEN